MNHYRSYTLLPVFALFVLFIAAGCADGGRRDTAPAAMTDTPDTIQEEVMGKISRRVLAPIPDEGGLREVRDRGVLRVALPAGQKPFQYPDPRFGLPSGFNPALANEIASILEVKPNITLLEKATDINAPEKFHEYDLVFLESQDRPCPSGKTIKYFFDGAGDWKVLCVSESGGPELADAIEEILIYLNETGIFARLYQNYVD